MASKDKSNLVALVGIGVGAVLLYQVMRSSQAQAAASNAAAANAPATSSPQALLSNSLTNIASGLQSLIAGG